MVRLKCTTQFYIICNIYIQKRVSLAWKYPKSTWFLHLKGPSNTFRLTARSCFQTQWLPWCTGCPGTSKLLAGAQRQWGQTCPAAEHNTVAKLVGKHYRKKSTLKSSCFGILQTSTPVLCENGVCTPTSRSLLSASVSSAVTGNCAVRSSQTRVLSLDPAAAFQTIPVWVGK